MTRLESFKNRSGHDLFLYCIGRAGGHVLRQLHDIIIIVGALTSLLTWSDATEGDERGPAGEETSPVGDSSEFSHRTSLSSAISSAEDISPQVSSGWSW